MNSDSDSEDFIQCSTQHFVDNWVSEFILNKGQFDGWFKSIMFSINSAPYRSLFVLSLNQNKKNEIKCLSTRKFTHVFSG